MTRHTTRHQQLQNYIEVSKVAGKVDGLRTQLASAAVAPLSRPSDAAVTPL